MSTDFDESNRLYFEELSHERVMDIAELESPRGVVAWRRRTPTHFKEPLPFLGGMCKRRFAMFHLVGVGWNLILDVMNRRTKA